MAKGVKDIDRGWRKLKAELLKIKEAAVVAVGVQGDEAGKERYEAAKVAKLPEGVKPKRVKGIKTIRGGSRAVDTRASNGGISNVRLAAVHEFGATINHPGGTPYIVTRRGAKFLSKGVAAGLPKGVKVTGPHTIKIPERSFLRATIDSNRQKYADLVTKLVDLIVTSRGKMTVERALGLLGQRVTSDVKNRIANGVPPPLKPATVARKGSSKPLIDTGQLRNSITYTIRPARQANAINSEGR